MKLTKIELEPTPGNYILATLSVDSFWDIDSYLFELLGVKVGGVERPDLYEAAEVWMTDNSEYLTKEADEERWHRADAI